MVLQAAQAQAVSEAPEWIQICRQGQTGLCLFWLKQVCFDKEFEEK